MASRNLGVMSVSASSCRSAGRPLARLEPVEDDARRLVDAERPDELATPLRRHLTELKAVPDAVEADVRSRHLRPVRRRGSVVDAVVEDDHVRTPACLQLAVEEYDLLSGDVPALTEVLDCRVDTPGVHQPREMAGDRLVVGRALAPCGRPAEHPHPQRVLGVGVVRRPPEPLEVDADEFAGVVPPVPYRVRIVDDALRRVELAEQRRDVVADPVICRRELSLVQHARHAVDGRRVEEPAVDGRSPPSQQIDGHDRQDGQSQDGEGGLQSFRLHGEHFTPRSRSRANGGSYHHSPTISPPPGAERYREGGRAGYDKTRRQPHLTRWPPLTSTSWPSCVGRQSFTRFTLTDPASAARTQSSRGAVPR